jgi:hypothetical protein
MAHQKYREKKPPRYYVRKTLVELKGQAAQLIETIDSALRQIDDVEEIRVFNWRCIGCGHVEHFTLPQPAKNCRECPKCKRTIFVPAGDPRGAPPLPD